MARVVIYRQPTNRRSHVVCDAMLAGIRRVGEDDVEIALSTQYTQALHDVAVFYGLAGRLGDVMTTFSASKVRRAVHIDLGYFGRRDGGRMAGYHKITVDDRHPTAYFRSREHSGHRIRQFGIKPAPWREPNPNAPVIIAGMGPKGAAAEGYLHGEWETEAARIIRRYSKRPIIYRPKPNCPGSPAIAGTIYTPPDSVPLLTQLAGAHAIVSHHSNANVEALVAGIPSFTEAGVAMAMGLSDLAMIETPLMPLTRDQWLADIAWCQWSVAEMAEGKPWRHLKNEGLIP